MLSSAFTLACPSPVLWTSARTIALFFSRSSRLRLRGRLRGGRTRLGRRNGLLELRCAQDEGRRHRLVRIALLAHEPRDRLFLFLGRLPHLRIGFGIDGGRGIERVARFVERHGRDHGEQRHLVGVGGLALLLRLVEQRVVVALGLAQAVPPLLGDPGGEGAQARVVRDEHVGALLAAEVPVARTRRPTACRKKRSVTVLVA